MYMSKAKTDSFLYLYLKLELLRALDRRNDRSWGIFQMNAETFSRHTVEETMKYFPVGFDVFRPIERCQKHKSA